VLTAWLGHHLGYAQYRQLIAHAPVGTHILRPPAVRSGSVGLWFGLLPRVQGAVLVQAVAAAMAYLMLAAFHVEPDLRQPLASEPGQPVEPGHPAMPGQPVAPADGVSWGPTGSTVPPESPEPPGSDPAASPRD
jgi:hypothetical protein